MERSIAKTLAVGAFSLALGAMVSGAPKQASADASAYSLLQITNFQLRNATSTAQLDASDFNFATGAGISVANNLSASVIGFGGALSGGAGPDIAQACAGVGCGVLVENTFSQVGAGEFGRADAQVGGLSITDTTGLLPPGGVIINPPSSASAQTVAEARVLNGNLPPVTVNTTGAINPVITTFQFTLASAQAITIVFDAVLEMQATLSGTALPGSIASAESRFSIIIQEQGTGTVVFNWTPDGALGGAGDIGVAAETDGLDINDSVTNVAAGTTVFANDPGGSLAQAGSFSVLTPVLSDTIVYTATLAHTSLANASLVEIPEPMTLALFGVGLLALGFFARQRQRKTDLAA